MINPLIGIRISRDILLTFAVRENDQTTQSQFLGRALSFRFKSYHHLYIKSDNETDNHSLFLKEANDTTGQALLCELS